MLRITQYIGPVLTFEMRDASSDEGAINVFNSIKEKKLKGKKMKFRTSEKGEVEVEVDNIKSMESIKPTSKNFIDDFCAGRI